MTSGAQEPAGPSPADPAAIARLHERIAARATARSHAFWNGYVDGSPPFLGVPMGAVRAALRAWWRDEGLDERPLAERKRLALALFDGSHAEQRLAGVLAFAEPLRGDLDVSDLDAFAELFVRERLADWNLTDWFCVKVLAAMIGDDPNPPTVARAVAGWRDAGPLWQRRAACVAFVPLAKEGDARIPELPDLVETACDALVADPARFAQTGVGWTMRELAKADPERATAFAERHLDALSLEALRSLAKGLDAEMAQRLVRAKKARGRHETTSGKTTSR